MTDDHKYWCVWMATMGLSESTDGYIIGSLLVAGAVDL